jgi:signal transduction histidine kinase
VRRNTIEQAAQREAKVIDQAKHRFLAALSHELRTPLTPVLLALHTMGRETALSPSMRDGLEMIRRNVDAEIQLIDDLLDVSRIVYGKLELSLSSVDLNDRLSQALEAARPEFAAKGIKLTLTLGARRQRRRCDGVRLQQVFGKLLRNAVKYTPAGGEVSASSRDSGERVVVEIKDSGRGIEAAALLKLFSPFYQGDPDEVRTYGGLGLGLAIAHAIVAAHGGTLTASSTGRNQGATFLVDLPAMDGAIAA